MLPLIFAICRLKRYRWQSCDAYYPMTLRYFSLRQNKGSLNSNLSVTINKIIDIALYQPFPGFLSEITDLFSDITKPLYHTHICCAATVSLTLVIDNDLMTIIRQNDIHMAI